MRTTAILFRSSLLILLVLCSAPRVSAQAPCTVKTFPGAMGFGACASGGRGAAVDKVLYVTSLADSGDYTLRWALEEKSGKRIVLFALPGVIELESDVVIREGDVTVIGLPYSPTITGATLIVKDDNVVLRHLAIKLGSRYGEIGACEPDDGCSGGKWCNEDCTKDALYLKNAADIMLDHLSLYWSTDEVLSADDVERVTVSNTIVAEPLHWALKNYENCKDGENCPSTLVSSPDWRIGHGYCQRWAGSKKVSILRSLFMNCFKRGLQTNSDGEFDTKLLLGNSVFYDYYEHAFRWNDNDGGGKDAQLVFYNNYFVAPHEVVKGQALSFDPPGYGNKADSGPPIDVEEPKNGSDVELWLQGNYEEGGGSNCNLLEGADDDGDIDCHGLSNLPGFIDDADPIPFHPAYSSQSNLNVYLQDVGRRIEFQLDDYDWDLVNAVLIGQNREMRNTEPALGPRGGGHHLGCQPGSQQALDLGDWDCDGMPDSWEQSHGLNWTNPSDGNNDQDDDGYTNVEEWMFASAP
jgi:hypothetical protein